MNEYCTGANTHTRQITHRESVCVVLTPNDHDSFSLMVKSLKNGDGEGDCSESFLGKKGMIDR